MEREKKCKSKRPRKGKEEKDRYKKDGFIDDYMAAEQTLNESAITRNLFIIVRETSDRSHMLSAGQEIQ